jgi:glycosyltransferase involved in cell wall biosynthesis
MNILFLSRDYPPNLIGGVGIYTLEMSCLLAREGHNVFVITSAEEFECEYVDKGVRVFRVKPVKFKIFEPLRDKIPGFLGRLEYSYAVSKKIAEVAKKFHIDIVESCEARMEGFWYFLLHRRPRLVIKLHTPESIVFKLNNIRQTLDIKFINILEDWWIERADKIVGLTDSIIDLSVNFFKIRKRCIPKVPNPIGIDFFKPLNKESTQDPGNVILYVGRLEFRKGVHILVKAIPLVLKEIPDAKFIFIGSDCGMKPYILSKTKEFNCQNNVVLIDEVFRENLLGYYMNAGVCVIPSLWENHPYVCLEALACGRPVIASRVGGLAEIIENNENGILVQPGSFKNLASQITELLRNKELQRKLSANARGFMETNYNAKKVAEKTINIYKELIKKK